MYGYYITGGLPCPKSTSFEVHEIHFQVFQLNIRFILIWVKSCSTTWVQFVLPFWILFKPKQPGSLWYSFDCVRHKYIYMYIHFITRVRSSLRAHRELCSQETQWLDGHLNHCSISHALDRDTMKYIQRFARYPVDVLIVWNFDRLWGKICESIHCSILQEWMPRSSYSFEILNGLSGKFLGVLFCTSAQRMLTLLDV